MNKTTIRIDKKLAQNVLTLVDKGLCNGLGDGTPGNMCVEAVICNVLGLPNGDNPPCVLPIVSYVKIKANDLLSEKIENNLQRAQGMRKLAIAQLGSISINADKFINLMKAYAAVLPLDNSKNTFLKLFVEGNKLYAEGDKLFVEGNKLFAEGDKLYAENNKLFVESSKLLAESNRLLAEGNKLYAESDKLYVKSYCMLKNGNLKEKQEMAALYRDCILQALIGCNSPGCKYLELCK